MYNSVVVKILVSIYDALRRWYRNSYLKKVVSSIGIFFRKNFYSSKLSRFNQSVRTIYLNSYFYRIFNKIENIFDRFFAFLNRIIKKGKVGSNVDSSLKTYNTSFESSFRLFYVVLLITGGALVLLSLLKVAPLNTKLVFILMAVGLVGTLINGNEINIIVGSGVVNFFLDLFKLDDGGENRWW